MSERGANPLSLGGLDRTKLDQLKAWIEPRAKGFSNRERTDRLLMLMQLQLNDLADVDAHASAIRDWLASNAGRPLTARRSITDHDGPSLLSPAAMAVRAQAEIERERRRRRRRR